MSKEERRIRYKEYILSDAWRAKRRQVIARAGGVCERCKKAPVQEVHHLTYDRFGAELLTDLAGLCQPCHRSEHGGKARKPGTPSRNDRRRRSRKRAREGWEPLNAEQEAENQAKLARRMAQQAAKIDRRFHRRPSKAFGEF